MEKIPTAKKLLEQSVDVHKYGADVEEAMIEFAKLHVKKALKVAAENAKEYGNLTHRLPIYNLDKESILNAYPETLIK